MRVCLLSNFSLFSIRYVIFYGKLVYFFHDYFDCGVDYGGLVDG